MKTLRYIAILVVLAFAVAFPPIVLGDQESEKAQQATASPAKETVSPAPTATPLRGAWRVDSMVSEGQATPAESLRRASLVFTGKKFTLYGGTKSIAEMEYTINAKAKPATIDIKYKGKISLGLFEFSKKRLRIDWNDPGKKRPAKMGSKCDGKLVLRPLGRVVRVADVKKGNPKDLIDHLTFTSGGSPEWSRDGRRLAYDAWRSYLGEGSRQAHLLVCNADGSNIKDLGFGAMPSWSPDGKKIAYSWYDPHGVWIMNADGTNRKLLDPRGWAIEWCPKGNKVAYTVGGGNIRVRDLGDNSFHDLLDDQYGHIYYGMSWSPDGKWVCFKGNLQRGGTHLAIVHVEGQKKGYRVLLSRDSPEEPRFSQNATWGPDSKQLIVVMVPTGSRVSQFYLVDALGKAKPKRLPWLNKNRSYNSPAWSPDGKTLLYINARRVPSSKETTSTAKAKD